MPSPSALHRVSGLDDDNSALNFINTVAEVSMECTVHFGIDVFNVIPTGALDICVYNTCSLNHVRCKDDSRDGSIFIRMLLCIMITLRNP